MRAHADEHPRWGYRRIHTLLVEDGWAVNLKRVHRLWRLEAPTVPAHRQHRGKMAGGSYLNSAWALPAVRPNHLWSYDFVAARTIDGGPLRILNIADEVTREAVGCHVARNIGAHDVVRVLDKLFTNRAKPAIIRSDNGREFIATTVCRLARRPGVTAAFIEKVSPQQNCYVERFNGTMRDELRPHRARTSQG